MPENTISPSPVILVKDPATGRVWYLPTEGMPPGTLDALLVAEIERLRADREAILAFLEGNRAGSFVADELAGMIRNGEHVE